MRPWAAGAPPAQTRAGGRTPASVTADAQGNADADAVDAGHMDADIQDTGLLGIFSTCTDSAQCESNLCFNFNARGMLCTYMCTNGACPVAGYTCNGMGYCKP